MVEKCLEDTSYVKEDLNKIVSKEFIKEINVWIHCLRLISGGANSSEVIKSFNGFLKAIWRVVLTTF